jgi:regulator of sigma E protease
MGILISLLVLSFLIFFHEFGHFLAARFFGVQVDVFSIGFGKKLYSKMIGDTEWSISAIPLGGYVKMKGQDDSDPTNISYDDDSYNTKKPWQRIIILLAGPFANFILAFLLYLAIANIGIPKALPIVGSIGDDTPALHAGLKKGDTILAINLTPVEYWEDIGVLINSSDTISMHVLIKRKNENIDLVMTPKVIKDKNIFGESITRKIIGITPSGEQKSVTLGLIGGVDYAWDETIRASSMIFQSVQKLLTGVVGTDQLGGVITIVDVTAKASHAGFVSLLFFTAFISVNLGVLNLLPIPALDGGHIMFNLYEIIRGKAPSEAVLYRLTIVGWVLLFGLMFLGLYNDINRLMR